MVDSFRVSVRVQPNARKNGIVKFENDVLYVKLTAPPVEGKANEALIRYLSHLLGIPKTNVSIERGFSGRNKILSVAGIERERFKVQIETAAATVDR